MVTDEELLALLAAFEEPPLVANDGQFVIDEEELVAGIFETLDRSQQRKYVEPIVVEQAYVDAEQFIASADPAFGRLIDTNRREQAVQRSQDWALRLDEDLHSAMDQWFEEQFRSSVERLGYGWLLRPQNAGRVCWQKEGF